MESGNSSGQQPLARFRACSGQGFLEQWFDDHSPNHDTKPRFSGCKLAQDVSQDSAGMFAAAAVNGGSM